MNDAPEGDDPQHRTDRAVVAKQCCKEVKGRKSWPRQSEPPAKEGASIQRVCLGSPLPDPELHGKHHSWKASQTVCQPSSSWTRPHGPRSWYSGCPIFLPSKAEPYTALVTQNSTSFPMSQPRKRSLSVYRSKTAASLCLPPSSTIS